jgi:hypothetical protein
MNKIFKILSFVILAWMLCAPSCEDEQETTKREENELSNSIDSIRLEFESGLLTEASLVAYEAAALQKLSDFTDYLQIVSDPKRDRAFREKASEMIKGIFVSDSVKFQLLPGKNAKEINVSELLNDCLSNELSDFQYRLDSVYIQQPLQRTGTGTYSGIIAAGQMAENALSKIENPLITYTVAAFLTRNTKVFGTDTLKVWEVRLGEIRLAE